MPDLTLFNKFNLDDLINTSNDFKVSSTGNNGFILSNESMRLEYVHSGMAEGLYIDTLTAPSILMQGYIDPTKSYNGIYVNSLSILTNERKNDNSIVLAEMETDSSIDLEGIPSEQANFIKSLHEYSKESRKNTLYNYDEKVFYNATEFVKKIAEKSKLPKHYNDWLIEYKLNSKKNYWILESDKLRN